MPEGQRFVTLVVCERKKTHKKQTCDLDQHSEKENGLTPCSVYEESELNQREIKTHKRLKMSAF